MIDLSLRDDLSLKEMLRLQEHLLDKDLGEFMQEWHQKLWQVWELQGENLQMTLITSVHTEEGRELFLYKIFGKGWLKNLDLIKQVLFVIATEAKASCITGVVKSRALARAYEKVGATHVSLHTYKLELPNGR